MKNTVKKIIAVTASLFILVASVLLSSSQIRLGAVQEPVKEAEKISRACLNITSDNDEHEKCVAHELADLGEETNLSFLVDTLTAYQSLEGVSKKYEDCHILSHRIMNDLISRNVEEWQDIIGGIEGQIDFNRCGGGFLHGTIEALGGVDPEFKVDNHLFQGLCQEILRGSSSCAHILGHLALVESFGAINEAQKACVGLSGDFLFQCYGGIFMEDTMRTNLYDHGLADLPVRDRNWFNDQFENCQRYRESPAMIDGCWYVMSEVFMQTHEFDLEKTKEFCQSAPLKSARDECYIRASYLFALLPDYMLPQFPAQELCGLYGVQNQELLRCMNTVVGALLTYSVSFADRAVAFCAARPDVTQSSCFKEVARHIARYKITMDEKRQLCGKLPKDQTNLCLEG